jgi:hypothetical protein
MRAGLRLAVDWNRSQGIVGGATCGESVGGIRHDEGCRSVPHAHFRDRGTVMQGVYLRPSRVSNNDLSKPGYLPVRSLS